MPRSRPFGVADDDRDGDDRARRLQLSHRLPVRPSRRCRWGVHRVHQEDLCQALGIDPSGARGRAKYEGAKVGPSFKQIARLLDAYAADPAAELDRLVAVVAYTVAIGNADAHGKNLALLHLDPETISLAPLYDTVPTALWPRLRSDAAMAIGGQVALADVGIEDIVREAVRWSHPADRARRVAVETLEGIAAAVARGVVSADGAVGQLVGGRCRDLLVGARHDERTL